MIKLRPHHILCIENFKGYGYDEQFTENMKLTINKLKSNENQKIKILFNTDTICSKCPNRLIDDSCLAEKKVKDIDDKIIKYFKIKEQEYCYKELLDYVKKNITIEMFNDICKECMWSKEICLKNSSLLIK